MSDDQVVEWGAAFDEKDEEIGQLKDLQRLSDDTIRLLNIENAQLRADRAGDQQRLFHYEAEIERCRNTAKINLKVAQDRSDEIERLKAIAADALITAASDYSKLRAECNELLALLRGALRHVISEGDDTLATIIRAHIARAERK